MTVTIRTDHKPLVPLLGEIPLDKLPLCIQRFRLALLRFSYKMEHVPGKENVVAVVKGTNRAAKSSGGGVRG